MTVHYVMAAALLVTGRRTRRGRGADIPLPPQGAFNKFNVLSKSERMFQSCSPFRLTNVWGAKTLAPIVETALFPPMRILTPGQPSLRSESRPLYSRP